MLQVFPFLTFLAPITSAVLLFVLWNLGELGRFGAALVGCFLVAGYCQFLASSAITGAVGLGLQTLLAIFLIVRWKLSSISKIER